MVGFPTAAWSNEPTPGRDTSLHWSAPSPCPDGERILELARALVLDEDWRLPPAVHADIAEADAGFAMTLLVRTRRESFTRHLEATDCEALAGAAAIIVALGAEPPFGAPIQRPTDGAGPEHDAPGAHGPTKTRSVAPLRPPPSPSAPATAPAPPVDIQPTVAGHSRSESAAESRTDLSVWALGGVGLGALPGGSAGGAFGVGLQWPQLAVELGARLWAPRRRNASDGTDRGGAFGLVAGSLRACWLRRFDRVVVPVCGAVLAGPMVGVGRGVAIENALRQVDPWIAVAASSGARIRILGPLSLRFDAEALVALLRPGFELLATGERLHRASSVGVRLWAGLHAHFSVFRKKVQPSK